jgi:polar amino acid transport system substrate-binding protein
MLPRSHWARYLLLAALPIGALLFAAACEDDDGEEEPAAPTATAAEADETPAETIDISGVPELEDGMLSVGSDIAYAPIEYYEEGTQNAVGMDVDLMAALAGALGVDFEFQQVADFGAIVLDLNSERYDVVMSAISITEERSAEIDFVPYFGPVGTGILVQAGNPEGIAAPEDLCGLDVAAQVGTYQVDQVNALNEGACADNPINLRTFPDNPTAVQELALGRVAAELADDPVAAYSAATSEGGLVEIATTRFEAAPYGIGVRKDSTELNAVLNQALEQIIADGTYLEILTDWEQAEFALPRD